MGTKAQLLGHLRPIIESSRSGPLLDVFSGMCSVGRTFSTARSIWANDMLTFPAMVGRLLFASTKPIPSKKLAREVLWDVYMANMGELKSRYREELKEEETLLLHSESLMALDKLTAIFEKKYHAPIEPSPSQQDIFSRLYGGIYFGHRQTIEIDSLRVAIERLTQSTHEIDRDWFILALAIAIGKVASTTGHFAQPLTPKANNSARILRQRKRSIYSETLCALDDLRETWVCPKGTNNRSYNSDALGLLAELAKHDDSPAVIYADPPYTKDQYSRYYHIYETLVSYQEPGCIGKGRYSINRPTSSFSSKRDAPSSLRKLIKLSAKNQSTLVLSYPSNGLVENSVDFIAEEIHCSFGKYPKVLEIDHMHSTMGGSKGAALSDVREHIYQVAA